MSIMNTAWLDTLRLSLVCLKVGTFVFGGGMTMIPMMEQDVVHRYHWLTAHQFADAVALGQMTPGPLLVSVTFVGYKVGGIIGATLATICIFLPSAIMTILVTHQLVKFKENPLLRAFMRGINPAVVGLIFAAGVSLGRACLIDIWSILFAIASLVLILRFKVDAVYIILGAGILGMLIYR